MGQMTMQAWLFIITLAGLFGWACWMGYKGTTAPSEGFREGASPPGSAARMSKPRPAA
ncbi:MAG: hypothetical protein OEY97_08905 [Nitrospirota bacterium]|nr:hypothetical protein [Nitrospirota bacterium]